MALTTKLASQPLRRRFLIGLAGLGAVSVLLTMLGLEFLLHPGFDRVEAEFAARDGERVHELVASELADVATAAADWGTWDDSFEFALGESSGFIQTNIMPDVLANLGLGVLAIYDAQGALRLAVEQRGGFLGGVDAGLERVLKGLVTSAGTKAAAGLLGTDQGAVIVALQPMRRSDGTGPPAGTLVMARWFDQAALTEFAQLARTRLTMLRPRDPALPASLGDAAWSGHSGDIAVVALGPETIAAYALFRDLNGAPLLVIRAEMPRLIAAISQQTARATTLGIVALSLLLLAAVAFLVQRLVVGPLLDLKHEVLARRRAADFSRPLRVQRQDEIGVLAVEFDALRADLDAARRRLEQLLSASADIVYSTSPDGRRFGFVSANVATMFDLAPERLVAEPGTWAACVLEEDRAALAYARARAAQGGAIDLQYRVLCGEARLRWVLDKLRPVLGADGQVIEIVGSWNDITDLKDAEELLRRWGELQADLAAKAEAASRAKSAFIAIMSHEIRTPLNGVVGAINLLAERAPAGEGRTMVDAARQSATRLQGVLSDVVDLSRLIAGEVSLEPAPLQPREVAAEAVAACRGPAEAKGLGVRVEVSPDVPATVLGDRSRLLQMLRNYLDNAVKFTPAGRIEVEVTCPAEGRLRFCVQDTGIGVPEDRRAGLFADFAQLDQSSARRFEGLGIGLTITRRLAELMGGAVGAAEAPGGGSRFWFEVRLPAIASAPALPARGPEPVPPEAEGRPAHVLMVEDNRTNQLILRSMLQRLGCSVEIAETGEAGVEAARCRDHDVIMMDINLPDIDGLEATGRIRALGIATPIIAVTASASEVDRERYRQAGMSACLGKPIDRTTLQAALRESLAGRRPREAAREPAMAHEA